MQKLRLGDPAGLEALMDRYTPYLSAIAARVLPGRPWTPWTGRTGSSLSAGTTTDRPWPGRRRRWG